MTSLDFVEAISVKVIYNLSLACFSFIVVFWFTSEKNIYSQRDQTQIIGVQGNDIDHQNHHNSAIRSHLTVWYFCCKKRNQGNATAAFSRKKTKGLNFFVRKSFSFLSVFCFWLLEVFLLFFLAPRKKNAGLRRFRCWPLDTDTLDPWPAAV